MPLKVLILVPGFPLDLENIKGGVHSAIINLLKGFEKKDIIVRLVSLDKIKEKAFIQFSPNIEIVYCPEGNLPFHSINYFIKGPSILKGQIKEFQPDIIHFEEGNSFLLIKSRGIAHKPYLLTVHGMAFAEGRAQKKISDKINLFYNGLLQVMLHPKNIIHISDYSLKMHPPSESGNTEVISNAISSSFFNLKGKAKTENLLLYIGVLNERKNILLLLKALSALREKQINYKLTVLGGFVDKEYEEIILNYINAHKLNALVEMKGWANQSEVQRYIEMADILVLPSRQETLPMVIAECMAASKPVIASDVGGISEMVINKTSGLVFINEDLNDLEKALEKLYNNDTEIKEMGINANKIALEKYHCDTIADKTISFYKKILTAAGKKE
ncbi:MAG: glycosyltransferase family 4 protein [Ferruginibacter sp.]